MGTDLSNVTRRQLHAVAIEMKVDLARSSAGGPPPKPTMTS